MDTMDTMDTMDPMDASYALPGTAHTACPICCGLCRCAYHTTHRRCVDGGKESNMTQSEMTCVPTHLEVMDGCLGADGHHLALLGLHVLYVAYAKGQ